MQVDLKERASENLSFIREAMARAERVSSVSGLATMAMGAIGLGAGALAATRTSLPDVLLVWLGAAVLAGALGAYGALWKTRQSETPLLADQGRRFLLCLLPPLATGALLTQSLWDGPELAVLPSFWLLLYGVGLLAAGTYAVPPVFRMGVGFSAVGIAAVFAPASWQNGLLIAGFGGLHLLFGYQVYRHHGG
ncbi:MAG: hypothetical protein AAGE43_04280 [Pseudomonadota bacterium]